MTRDDLARFCALDIDFEAIGLMEPGVPQSPYFCTPVGAEYVGHIGVDGIHFILLPDDERVFCVSPMALGMNAYCLPVAEDFRAFLSYLLYCRSASPLEQIAWLGVERFRRILAADAAADWPGVEELRASQARTLSALAEAFRVGPADPYERVRALQAAFDPACLTFSDEYYDVLDIERP